MNFELKSAVEWTETELNQFRENYRINYLKGTDQFTDWDKVIKEWEPGTTREFTKRNEAMKNTNALRRRGVKNVFKKIEDGLYAVTREEN